MNKYRKKPIIVEAIQLTPRDFDRVIEFIDYIYLGNYSFDRIDCLIGIQTLEGTMLAKNGDWIIKGVNGEYYPCKPDVFEKTYEAIHE